MIPKNIPKSPSSLKKLKLPDATAAENNEQLQKNIIECEDVIQQKSEEIDKLLRENEFIKRQLNAIEAENY